MRKKRVLFLTEAAYLSTGYATYSRNVLQHMHSTNNYELAELSIYGSADDQRRALIPWKNYPNLPDASSSEEEKRVYNSNPTNVFGAWRFERACLDFKPDVVLSIRDFWMDSFIYESPFRRIFKWIFMPTVDAAPQNEEWIHQFCNDSQSGGNANTLGSASPAASQEFQMAADKEAAKKALGFPDGARIIGSVMRNQRRKLFPVLIEAFANYLKTSGDKKTYLHIHSSYPDGGWDFGELLHKHGVSSRVYFTYVCSNPECGSIDISKFNDCRKACSKCRQFSSTQTNVNNGVDDDTLAKIYNAFDLYVQCANCEGFGLPQVEAAACGVPIACTNYSAMEDVVKKLNAYPIKVESLYKELETGCMRAVPSIEDLTRIFNEFFSQTFIEINNKRIETRRLYETHYSWKKTAEKWMEIIDALDYADWSTPPIIKPVVDIPLDPNESNTDFLRKCSEAYLIDPSRIHSHPFRVMLRDLNSGVTKPSSDGFWSSEFSPFTNRVVTQGFNREKVLEILKNKLNTSNAWEQARINPNILTDKDAKWLKN
jgi:glycosyltransferase involved in cell wall biosynthesis